MPALRALCVLDNLGEGMQEFESYDDFYDATLSQAAALWSAPCVSQLTRLNLTLSDVRKNFPTGGLPALVELSTGYSMRRADAKRLAACALPALASLSFGCYER